MFFWPFKKTNQVIYKYHKQNGYKYPAVEVLFKNNTSLKYVFILDSGADITIVPKSVGEILGFKKTKLHYLGGVGGRIGYYVNKANIKLAGKSFNIDVAWSTSDEVPLLLGRKDVFNKFKICFIEKKSQVIFK